jgi:hypothetical protein
MKTWLVICGVIVFAVCGIGYIASVGTYHSTNDWAQPIAVKVDPAVQAFFEISTFLGAALTAAGLAANKESSR